jgi:DNA mismatch endonuclease, patch repair protein
MNERKIYFRDGRSPIPDNEITSKTMSSIKAINSKPEMDLRRSLWKYGIKGYRLHWKKVPGRPDVAFPHKKVAIFVNGCFWHRCPICKPNLPKSHSEFWKIKFQKSIERDKQKNSQLKKLGWNCITLWECQIKQDINACVDKIKVILI